MPTPHGDIMVSWSRTNDVLHLDLTVPSGCEATVITGKKRRAGPGHHEFKWAASPAPKLRG